MKQTLAVAFLMLCATYSRAATIAIDDVSATHMDVTVQWSPTDLGYDFGWAQTDSPSANASVQAWKEDQFEANLDALTININPPFYGPVALEVRFDDKGILFSDATLSYFKYSLIPSSVTPIQGGDGMTFSLDVGGPLTLASAPVPEEGSSLPMIMLGCFLCLVNGAALSRNAR